MQTLITGGTIVTPYQTLVDYTVLIEKGTVVALQPSDAGIKQGAHIIDATGMWVTPGLIDVHVHGSAGHDAMDATPEAIYGMARFFAQHGVTAYLPTTITATLERISAAIECVKGCSQPRDGAQHLGVHLEGPYLNPEHKGAQPVEHLRDPNPDEFEAWLQAGVVRLVTLAPECNGALSFIEHGVSAGVEFAVGHSGATYEQMIQAVDRGLRQATHTFNGMLGLHHREPGTVGAVLADDRIYAQVIVDGIHLHPAVVKILVRAKGAGRTILITDAIRAAGLADGDYELGGQIVTVQDGIARTAEGSLAGSTLTMDAALRNVIRYTGLSLNEALQMATSTPAEAMGWGGRKGVLAPGADADLILLDADLNVRLTMVGGQIVYSNERG